MKTMRLTRWMSFFAVLSLGSVTALAKEVTILTATSDAIEGNLVMNLIVDDEGTVEGLKYYAPSKTETFKLDDLPKGLVLYRHSNHDVIRVVSTNFSPKTGGTFTMDYLVSGINGQRARYPVELDRQGQDWIVYANLQTGRKVFTKMHFKANRFLGQVIGIKEISIR